MCFRIGFFRCFLDLDHKLQEVDRSIWCLDIEISFQIFLPFLYKFLIFISKDLLRWKTLLPQLRAKVKQFWVASFKVVFLYDRSSQDDKLLKQKNFILDSICDFMGDEFEGIPWQEFVLFLSCDRRIVHTCLGCERAWVSFGIKEGHEFLWPTSMRNTLVQCLLVIHGWWLPKRWKFPALELKYYKGLMLINLSANASLPLLLPPI